MSINKKEIYDQLPDELKELVNQMEAAIADISNGVNVQDRISEIRKIRNDLTKKRDAEVLNPSVSSAINKVVNELLLLETEVLAKSGNLPKDEHHG
ncbi:hypothetical protein [uncultured Dysgonomonas sp.]|uniref:Uncharacterized protein n=1 Tax=uncultured Dysgonomonas sp. TaxID=206096 RepID=A0A212IXN1_9BACT|nr:hypothetical protein [uncultured Dysgonomonas sp.]SBV91705.1 hypothetical protein KL86DYS1_10409 [uncultured Dysgonomonas sp.]